MLALTGNESRLKVSEFKLSTLLEITNAINNNLPEEQLFVLFQYILEHQLNIGKAVVFLNQEGTWESVLHFGVSDDELNINIERDLKGIRDITVMEMMGIKSKSFDVVIPVFHQSKIIAYLMLGDIDEQEMRASPIIRHLPFIQTLANLTAVAVENKRLVRESLKQERVKRELEMASEMQGLLLPNELPNNENLQVAAFYRPHQEVGGDFYDVIRISEEEYIFCMADVSGKGISAAILMASFQANLRANAQVGKNLEDIAQDLNKQVWNNAQGERFITMFLARYNTRSRKMHYVNAAHPSPLLLNEGSSIDLTQGCVGLGMFDELPFVNSGKEQVASNSLFICYTDGLDELENDRGDVFDRDSLKNAVESFSYKDMFELNEKIMLALNNHRGRLDFHDDIALISCRFF
ncbi:MAG: PP2C family protein-serine/threonine phosphatase [Flavobacteriales bacterium]